jgi:hypothetical protein
MGLRGAASLCFFVHRLEVFTMKLTTLRPIMAAVAKHDCAAAVAAIDAALVGETGVAWIRELSKLRGVFLNNAAAFKVFAIGNSKLPFLAWSSLPGEGFCHGAGDCLTAGWCYSFKAHRYPAAFARQAQNSWLLGSSAGRAAILAALDKFEPRVAAMLDFRLYVDGDFSSVDQVGFWMAAIAARPWLRAYGYSKAWRELLAYNVVNRGEWPANYRMNLSSGSKHGADIRELVSRLPIVRGEFIAVPNVGSTKHGDREHNVRLRAAFAAIDSRKAFTCPGKCGECTPTGHACGSDRFRGIPIIIAAH